MNTIKYVVGFVWILCIVLNVMLAWRKHRSIFGWIVGGIFLSWISTVILFALPVLDE